MKACDIVDSMNELNDETIEAVGESRKSALSTETVSVKTGRSKRRWLIAAACLLLVVGFFRMLPSGKGETILRRPISDGRSGVYYESSKKCFLSGRYTYRGDFYYDGVSAESKPVRLLGQLINTQLGPVLLEKGSLYLLDGTEKKLLGSSGIKDQKYIEFEDIDESYAYYIKNRKQLYREDLKTGSTDLLIDVSEEKHRYIEANYLFIYQGKIYYYDFIRENEKWYMAYSCMDPETGTVTELPRFCSETAEDFSRALAIKVYDHYLIAAAWELGIRIIDLDTNQLRAFDTNGAECRFAVYDGYLYIDTWNRISDEKYTEPDFRRYDIATGKYESVEDLRRYRMSEFVVQKDGIYYNIAGGPDNGLYYYSFIDKSTRRID